MDQQRLSQLLNRFPGTGLIVLGDYFLDSYLILERSLSEISIETGLEAYQVVSARTYPGAAGTVVSNLRALGVNVFAVGLVGDDGNGYELHKRLVENQVDVSGLIQVTGYPTPTYMKPIMREPNGSEHELNRMDVKNRKLLAHELEDQLIDRLRTILPKVNGILVVDQVQERNCGVITDRMRLELRRLAISHPEKVIIADSREYLSGFDSIILKANIHEAARSAGIEKGSNEPLSQFAGRCARIMIARTDRPIIITLGSEGLFLLEDANSVPILIPAVPVTGPIDIVGAGDSVNAAVGSALCSGASLAEAGFIASLVASIVIHQIGVTGTATPQQVLELFQSLGKQ
jgi:rfaE bifunctional protein kinase chain/domain